jgi:hypothetical protein
MRVTNSQDIHINDYLRDGVLLKVTDSNPLYANIVNYMVTGYILPGGTRKSGYTKARNICGMIPMYIDCVVMVYFEDVCPLSKDCKSLRNVMRDHMEDIMVFSAHMQKTGTMISFGQPCMMTPRNSFEDAKGAKNMGESLQDMQCPYKIIFK